MCDRYPSVVAMVLRFAAPVILAFVEARPLVQAMFALRFLVGGRLAVGVEEISLWRAASGQLAWLATAWFVYLLNGLTDIDGDRLNGSRRPLASGRMRPVDAYRICWGLALIAVGLSFSLGPSSLLLCVVMLVAGWLYSAAAKPAKEGVMAATVAFILGGMATYQAGAACYGRTLDLEGVVFAVLISLWMGAGGQWKDFADAEGDRVVGRRTLPVVLGPVRAAYVVLACCVVVALIGCVLGLSDARMRPALLLVPAVLVMAWLSPRSAANKTVAHKQRYGAFMDSQLAINVAMLVPFGALV